MEPARKFTTLASCGEQGFPARSKSRKRSQMQLNLVVNAFEATDETRAAEDRREYAHFSLPVIARGPRG